MRESQDTALSVEDLCMRYGSTEVLRDVTFQVRRGEVLCLLGPNGAGKTTTIEVLEGFRSRSAGQVQVLGLDPEHATERWKAGVGVVLQSWRDHRKWRVRELLVQLGQYYGPYSTSTVSRPWPADELIDAVGLAAQAGQKVQTLSGGQRRRLDVAIGLVGRPELIFLDEPTAGLDPVARSEFHELVAGLGRGGETTIMLTTHDLAEAEKLADRIIVLNHGRIVADGTTRELAAQIAGEDTVSWIRDGQEYRQSTPESTKFAFGLFEQYGNTIEDLEIRRASLEDTYLALVHQASASGRGSALEASGRPGP
jgi:ABC-2 type transport system ATP-binding protein